MDLVADRAVGVEPEPERMADHHGEALGSVSYRLEDGRHALALADAHRRQAQLRALVAHPVQQRGRDPGAAGAQGVADRDRAAARVDLVFVDAQQLEHGQDLDGERLVELDAIDLVEGQPGPLQGFLGRRARARCPSPRD